MIFFLCVTVIFKDISVIQYCDLKGFLKAKNLITAIFCCATEKITVSSGPTYIVALSSNGLNISKLYSSDFSFKNHLDFYYYLKKCNNMNMKTAVAEKKEASALRKMKRNQTLCRLWVLWCVPPDHYNNVSSFFFLPH